MRTLIPLALAAAMILPAGCRKAGAAVPTDLLYVDEIEAPTKAKAGEDVVVTIHGNAPDPSWHWDRNDVALAHATVTIDVIGRKASDGPVAMVLVPFTTTATLSGLPAGTWDLVVRGRQRAISRPLEVTP
jgi:hypothetical protein